MTHRQAILIVIAIAAFLRFYGLRDEGIALYDEGYLYGEARVVHDGLALLLQSDASQSLATQVRDDSIMSPPRDAKPLQHAVLALLMFVTGARPESALFLAALYGLATVVAVYFLTTRLYPGRSASLFATAVLAVMGYHVLYSRTALAETGPTFFLVLSLFLWRVADESEPPSRRHIFLVLAGLALAATVTSNYRFLVTAALLPAFAAVSTIRRRGPFAAVRETALLVAPIPLLGLLFEAPYALMQSRGVVSAELPSYFEQLRGMMMPRASVSFDLDPLFYAFLNFHLSGGIAVILFLGIIYALIKHTREDLLVVAFALLPALFFSLYPGKGARFFVGTLPFLAIAGGRLVAASTGNADERSDRLGRRGLIVFAVILTIGIVGFRRHLGLSSGHARALTVMAMHGTARHVSTNPNVANAYLSTNNRPELRRRGHLRPAMPVPETMAELRELHDLGHRWLVVDAMRGIDLLWRRDGTDGNTVWEIVEAELNPAFSVENLAGGGAIMTFEHYAGSGRIAAYRELQADPAMSRIRIYDLDELF